MNRTLQYLKNIRFNPIINKNAAQRSKQKYTVNESKKRHQQVIIRKYTTYSNNNNNNNNNHLPPNPNDPFWIMVMMASSCGLLNIMRDIYSKK
jgi:hypothetical protein